MDGATSLQSFERFAGRVGEAREILRQPVMEIDDEAGFAPAREFAYLSALNAIDALLAAQRNYYEGQGATPGEA